MSFRKTSNRHDCWLAIVRENPVLLEEIPVCALESELAFRDYVTTGAHRGVTIAPGVAELSTPAIHHLWRFINHKTYIDMDAGSFDAFNKEYRNRCSSPVLAINSEF
jgi:hypothetical protein